LNNDYAKATWIFLPASPFFFPHPIKPDIPKLSPIKFILKTLNHIYPLPNSFPFFHAMRISLQLLPSSTLAVECEFRWWEDHYEGLDWLHLLSLVGGRGGTVRGWDLGCLWWSWRCCAGQGLENLTRGVVSVVVMEVGEYILDSPFRNLFNIPVCISFKIYFGIYVKIFLIWKIFSEMYILKYK